MFVIVQRNIIHVYAYLHSKPMFLVSLCSLLVLMDVPGRRLWTSFFNYFYFITLLLSKT